MDLLINERLANGEWLFGRVSSLFNGPPDDSERISPPVDVVEDHDGYRFSVDLPGLKSNSLEVKVEDGTLVINAERNVPASADGTRVHRAERHYGRIRRAFRLPDDVSHGTVKAAYKDGVLEVTIGKLPEAKAVTVEVAYNS
jgi:HSP20 family protein